MVLKKKTHSFTNALNYLFKCDFAFPSLHYLNTIFIDVIKQNLFIVRKKRFFTGHPVQGRQLSGGWFVK